MRDNNGDAVHKPESGVVHGVGGVEREDNGTAVRAVQLLFRQGRDAEGDASGDGEARADAGLQRHYVGEQLQVGPGE